jgi:hypothetical protein
MNQLVSHAKSVNIPSKAGKEQITFPSEGKKTVFGVATNLCFPKI